MRLRNLPPESRFKTALRNETPEQELKQLSEGADPSTGQWSHTEMLIAQMIDTLRDIRYTLVRVNGGKGKPPAPLPRPGVKPKGKRKRKPLTEAQAEFLYRRLNPDAE
jgi:hypothetical protein